MDVVEIVHLSFWFRYSFYALNQSPLLNKNRYVCVTKHSNYYVDLPNTNKKKVLNIFFRCLRTKRGKCARESMTHNVRVYVPEEAELIYRSLRDCGKTEKLNKFLRNSRKFELLLDGVVQFKIQRLNCNCARSTKVSIPLPIKSKHDVELINFNIVKRHNLLLNFNSQFAKV